MSTEDRPHFDDLDPEGGDAPDAPPVRPPSLKQDSAARGEAAAFPPEPGSGEPEDGADFDLDDGEAPHAPPSRQALPALAARAALQGARLTAPWSNAGRHAEPVESGASGGMSSAPAVVARIAGASAAALENYDLLDTLAAAAARARSGAEAQALAAAMLPPALQLAPGAYRALWPALPALAGGLAGVAGLLYHYPATRSLLLWLPAMLQGTIGRLAVLVNQGVPLTAPRAGSVLAKQCGRVILQCLRQAAAQSAPEPAPRTRARSPHPAAQRPNGRTRSVWSHNGHDGLGHDW